MRRNFSRSYPESNRERDAQRFDRWQRRDPRADRIESERPYARRFHGEPEYDAARGAWEEGRYADRDEGEGERDGRRARALAGETFYGADDEYAERGFGSAGYRAPDTEHEPFERERGPRPARPRMHRMHHATPRESYFGRGPRGYRRSDERIREEICERLYSDHDIDASDIDVQVVNGEVTLEGSVGTRPQKRGAEDLSLDVFGVEDVINHLRIQRGREAEGPSAARAQEARGS